MRSFEELEIANWLYENGIEYEYEPDYEHAVSTQGRRDYTPDFRLKESGVYIEHFGVRRKRGPDGNDVLTTADRLPAALSARHGLSGHGGIKPDRQRARVLQRLVAGRPVPGLAGRGGALCS